MSATGDKQLSVRGASGPLARVGTSTAAKPSSLTPLDEDAFTEVRVACVTSKCSILLGVTLIDFVS